MAGELVGGGAEGGTHASCTANCHDYNFDYWNHDDHVVIYVEKAAGMPSCPVPRRPGPLMDITLRQNWPEPLYANIISL